jgi:DNA-binding NarL/FixJ family response regulator
MGSERIRVLIADDHRLFREALRAVLERECDVVAEAASGEEAVALAARIRPDIVLLASGCRGWAASTRRIAWPSRRRPPKS